MSEITTRCGFEYEAQGSENWYQTYLRLRQMLDQFLCPGRVFEVSPEFTSANLHLAGVPTSRRHFHSIQAAIDAWEAGGFGDGTSGGIYIYPGRYAEDLTITKSVALVAMHGGPLDSGGAARGVYLLGAGGGGPVITFDPADDESHGLLVKGMSIRNTSEAGSGTYPFAILHALDQGAGNYGPYQHPIVFDDCNFRLTLNSTAWWHAAFRAMAGHWLTMKNCRLTAPSDYAAGNYYRYIFLVEGNSSRASRLSIKGGEYNHPVYSGVTNFTAVATNGYSSMFAHRATFNRTPSDGLYTANFGGEATGFTVAEAEAHGNLLGVNAVEF